MLSGFIAAPHSGLLASVFSNCCSTLQENRAVGGAGLSSDITLIGGCGEDLEYDAPALLFPVSTIDCAIMAHPRFAATISRILARTVRLKIHCGSTPITPNASFSRWRRPLSEGKQTNGHAPHQPVYLHDPCQQAA